MHVANLDLAVRANPQEPRLVDDDFVTVQAHESVRAIPNSILP